MEDATKAWPHLRPGVGFETETSPQGEGDSAAPTAPAEPQTVGQKRQDRWFLEERGGKKVPKRLEIANELRVSSGGPLYLTGNVTLIDEDGSVTHANHLTLCRCGSSRNKPICDESHVEIEFLDGGRIDRASDCMPLRRPQTVTITCVKDGPLKFRGYLRIHNSKGQECLTMQGALCRCGRSSRKPFCDCQ